jgi:hypothetical protein
MTLSNILQTPTDALKSKNSGEPELDGLTPGSVQIRRLEDGMVERYDWVKRHPKISRARIDKMKRS